MAYMIRRGDDVEIERCIPGGVAAGHDGSAVKPERVVQGTVYLRRDQVARKVHRGPIKSAPFSPAIARHSSPLSPSLRSISLCLDRRDGV